MTTSRFQCPKCGAGLAHRYRVCPQCGASRMGLPLREPQGVTVDSWTAYLIGYLDTTTLPPRLAHVRIYSEPAPTAKVTYHQFTILRASGPSFSAARATLLTRLRATPHLGWVHRLLPDSDQLYGEPR